MPLAEIGARLRAICLALPEANEELMRRGPSYRVADKIFALERPWNDWLALWCKVPECSREIMLEAEPVRFFIPPDFGAKGWIGVALDEQGRLARNRGFRPPQLWLVAPSGAPSSWRKAFTSLVASPGRSAQPRRDPRARNGAGSGREGQSGQRPRSRAKSPADRA